MINQGVGSEAHRRIKSKQIKQAMGLGEAEIRTKKSEPRWLALKLD
jgi:hypothetical protein